VESSQVPATPTGGSALLSDTRKDLVDALAALGDDHPGLSARELAERLGLHVTTIRFHLDRLVGAGIVHGRRGRPPTVGRPGRLFTLSTGYARPTMEDQFRMLVELLTEAYRSGRAAGVADPVEFGERWAERLFELLSDWGYAGEGRR